MKVYFNNSCKICRAEINMYKKENINQINWIDITNNNNAKLETKKNEKELLRRLHVIKDGEIFSGAQAFLLVSIRASLLFVISIQLISSTCSFL